MHELETYESYCKRSMNERMNERTNEPLSVGFDIYQFLWNEYADWFIEVSKTRFEAGGGTDPAAATQARRVLVYVFDTCLRLLHPFMPFVTEALWQEVRKPWYHKKIGYRTKTGWMKL